MPNLAAVKLTAIIHFRGRIKRQVANDGRKAAVRQNQVATCTAELNRLDRRRIMQQRDSVGRIRGQDRLNDGVICLIGGQINVAVPSSAFDLIHHPCKIRRTGITMRNIRQAYMNEYIAVGPVTVFIRVMGTHTAFDRGRTQHPVQVMNDGPGLKVADIGVHVRRERPGGQAARSRESCRQ